MAKEKSNVSPEDYRKFINNLSLLRIELIETEFKRDEVFEFPAKVTIKDDSKFKLLDEKQGLYTVLNHHQLTAVSKNKEKPGLKIDVTFKFTYQDKSPPDRRDLQGLFEAKLGPSFLALFPPVRPGPRRPRRPAAAGS